MEVTPASYMLSGPDCRANTHSLVATKTSEAEVLLRLSVV